MARATFSDLPVFGFTTHERLDEFVALHRANGIAVANPHFYTLEEGSANKTIPCAQLALKRDVDPLGLLNPGKMRSFAL